jgi:hypothetical protein
LLLAQCRPERDGATRFAVRFRAPGPSLSPGDLNQPRRGEHQVNKSAVVVLAVAERARNVESCFQLAGVEPMLDSTEPEGRIRMHGPLVGQTLRGPRPEPPLWIK